MSEIQHGHHRGIQNKYRTTNLNSYLSSQLLYYNRKIVISKTHILPPRHAYSKMNISSTATLLCLLVAVVNGSEHVTPGHQLRATNETDVDNAITNADNADWCPMGGCCVQGSKRFACGCGEGGTKVPAHYLSCKNWCGDLGPNCDKHILTGKNCFCMSRFNPGSTRIVGPRDCDCDCYTSKCL
jgi:hypothetical protein